VIKISIKNKGLSRALVAHACNPSYLGAEIRRILVQSQSRQIVHETLYQKYPTQRGLVEWLRL
jgi:hypothetical protein